MKVAILGASSNPDRYAYKALRMLQSKKHDVYLISPTLEEFEDLPCFKSIKELGARKESIHTLTLYVNSFKVAEFEKEIIELKPQRVIFNPGTENSGLKKSLEKNGIHCDEACTLVLLSTNQF